MFILVISLCLSLCSCQLIDDARAAHGIYTDKNIQLGEDKYILLPYSYNLRPNYDYSSDTIYATEPDVPVLLSSMLGTPLYKSNDGVFLITVDDELIETIYCKEDKYQEIIKYIENPIYLNRYYYEYTVQDKKTYESSSEYYLLTKEETSVIDEIIRDGEVYEFEDLSLKNYEILVTLNNCADNINFKGDLYYDIYTIEGYYFLVETDNELVVYHRVPDKHIQTIKSILADYYLNENNSYIDGF
ncbi:MAG: hypothetical protein E7560_04250 [Ruminococcaceae bacterium]|nr:hypothetical protein [Oscillospiraceae bacterium]